MVESTVGFFFYTVRTEKIRTITRQEKMPKKSQGLSMESVSSSDDPFTSIRTLAIPSLQPTQVSKTKQPTSPGSVLTHDRYSFFT